MQDDINWRELYDLLTEKYNALEAIVEENEKIIARTKKEEQKIAREKLVTDILAVFDNLEHLRGAIKYDCDLDAIREAVSLIFKNFMEFFVKQKIIVVEAAPGTQFNPVLHEAVAVKPSNSVPKDYIIEEVRKGFKSGDTLIRAANVVVSSGMERID